MKRDYRTVIGILEARLKGESYSWIQCKFGIGSSTVTRIAKIFQGLGISFEELCRKEPAEVVELFYTNPTRSLADRRYPGNLGRCTRSNARRQYKP